MEDNKTFDQNLYSRQAAVYGESMGKLIKMGVYLYGLRGTGIEVAKNVCLAGPASLTIHDPGLVTLADLGTNFYLTETQVGQRRDHSCEDRIRELNQYVQLKVRQEQQIIQDLSFYDQFQVVVFTDNYQVDQLVAINNYCRSRDIGFIVGGTLGVYGYCFTDFGSQYKNFDKDGEQNRQCIVTNISKEQKGLVVTVHEDKKHLFQDSDFVVFREVEGMTQINGKTYPIEVISPLSFYLLGESEGLSDYTREGVVEQVKVQTSVPFRGLQDSFQQPIGPDLPPQDRQMINPDMLNFGRAEQLHLGLQAVYQFWKVNNRCVQADCQEQIEQVVQMARDINAHYQKVDSPEGVCCVEEIDQEAITSMVRFGESMFSPVTSFFGAVLSQEIIKHTGKFMPLRQWLHTDFFKVLPTEPCTRQLNNDRYDHLVQILGNQVCEKLQKQKVFMIGAGALGCEFLKIFALMGLGLKENNGKVTVTDDDQIEVSNLNRQFLFRKENVGGSKSMVATEASRQMNNEFNGQGVKLRTCVETEEFFNDEFWDGLDFVVNAVDNVQARLYVDSRCVFYQKALFESGTLGTKCNSQVILPKLTQSYGETPDQKEEEFAICTLKNFPYLIEHTIQWARDLFEGVFVDGPNQLRQFIHNPAKFVEALVKQNQNKFGVIRGKLETIKELLLIMESDNKEQAVLSFSRRLFEDSFHHIIAELQNNFPQEHRTEEGQLFWSGPKRYPLTQPFEAEDTQHRLFMVSCGNILMEVLFSQKGSLSVQSAVQLASQTDMPKYVVKKLRITGDKQNTELVNDEDEDKANELIKSLSSKDCSAIKDTFNLQEFEKDDDTNYHIDFLTATSNLRARNYRIAEVDHLKVKLTAGKIIPAIATTTAMVCGAITIEMLKYIQQKPIDEYKNTFMNLAVNLFLFTDPLPPTQSQDKDYDPIMMGPVKAIPKNFTVWDSIYLDNVTALKDVFTVMKDKYNVNLSIIGCGKATIYNSYGNQAEMKNRMEMSMKDLYKKVAGIDFPAHKKYMEIEVSGDLDDGTDTVMPTVVIKIK